ncbi:hypothetical protein KP509_1Z004800 [Ceratopteris richardii]|nr:hypothetical protein KP509_1Z004800 [Ceratopteris richardii]
MEYILKAYEKNPSSWTSEARLFSPKLMCKRSSPFFSPTPHVYVHLKFFVCSFGHSRMHAAACAFCLFDCSPFSVVSLIVQYRIDFVYCIEAPMGALDEDAFPLSQRATAPVFQDPRHTKPVHDNVHKTIYLDPLSQKFIDTEQFQRLVYILYCGVRCKC